MKSFSALNKELISINLYSELNEKEAVLNFETASFFSLLEENN